MYQDGRKTLVKELMAMLAANGWILAGKRSFSKGDLRLEFVEFDIVRVVDVFEETVVLQDTAFLSVDHLEEILTRASTGLGL